MKTELIELTLTEAVEGLRARQFSCREYVAALIERCVADREICALMPRDWQSLLDAADRHDNGPDTDGKLTGVPLVLKDNINTSELTTTAATCALRGHVAKNNAPVAQALFDEGALLGAKGNMHELAFGITSNNALTGAVCNPYDRTRIPGGSSGGVAAAVAARMMPAGIGTDTGASVRLPAALCGLVGFRPTVGRYDNSGIVPISHTRDTAGAMTRSVADAVLLDAVMAGTSIALPRLRLQDLRIGVPRELFYENLDTETARLVSHALEQLGKAGVELVEIGMDGIAALNEAVSTPVALYEFMRDLQSYLADNDLDLSLEDVFEGIESPDVKGVFGSQLGDDAMPEATYLEAVNTGRPRLQKAYEDYFAANRLDAALFATSPLPARPIGHDATVELNGAEVPTFETYIRNTDPASNAGIPAISLPVGLAAGSLPVGVELDGPSGRDERLLAVAKALEPVICVTTRPSR